MDNMLKMLKVKIKSLAEEARIIRMEERRALPRRHVIKTWQTVGHPRFGLTRDTYPLMKEYADFPLYQSLRIHRITDVRKEQRCSLLAYAFLRGKPFLYVEKPIRYRNQHPDWDRVFALVKKFGSVPGSAMYKVYTKEDVLKWMREPAFPVS